MSTLRSDDDDRRGEDMGRPGYWSAAWERGEAEVLAERAAQPPACRRDGSRRPSTLVPGVVAMSLRGDAADVNRMVERMRSAGLKVWHVRGEAASDGRAAGFRYFSVEVPEVPGG